MNVFDLAAKITLDKSDYEKGLKGAESKLSEVGGKLGAMGSKIASGIGTAMKVGAAAVGAASTAVGALVTKSVTAYADYEQMVGGVQKLYGTMGQSLEEYAKAQGKSIDEVRDEWTKLDDAQNLVLKNAQNAYKTAGMSANQYMEIATSFSASLINSLDGDSLKAAEATDKAMRAISDNWNTFGGDIGMVQGAFQGFAKGNYTMLDNLKLGYGGTKEQMELLIKDANEYAKSIGEASDLSMDSFADIVTAIDLIQQKQNIAGTTAREASTTISGSLGMAKAAWENLVTGMSDSEADLDGLMNNLVDSIVGYTDKTGEHVNGVIDNILPVAEKALAGVSTLIEKLAPKIAEEMPKLISTVLPSLLSAGIQIMSALGRGFVDNLPVLLDYVNGLLGDLLHAIMDFDFSKAASSMIDSLTDIGAKAGDLLEYGLLIISEIARGITEAIPTLMETGTEIIMSLADDLLDELPYLIETGFMLLTNIIEGITQALPDLAEKAVQIIETIGYGIVENLPLLIETAAQLILTLALGIAQALPELMPTIIDVVLTIVDSLISNVDLLIDAAIALMMGLTEGLISALPVLLEKAPEIIQKLVDAIVNNVPKLLVASAEMITKLVVGIVQNLPKLLESGIKIITSLQTGIVRMFVKLVTVGKDIVEKIKNGIKSIDPVKWGQDMMDSFINGIKDRISKIIETAKDVAGTIKDYLGFSEPKKGPLSNFHTFAPDMMQLFADGIAANKNLITDAINDSFNLQPTISAGMVYNSSRMASIPTSNINTNQSQPINVNITLEGDAERLFRVVSIQAQRNQVMTGNYAF